jgi:hypothetical protein
MKIIWIFLLGFYVIKGNAQQKEINKELNFTLKFIVENDTIAVNKEYSIIVNGAFPKDNSGHQGGRKENFRKTDNKGNFKLYIMNSGEYEFIILGKGSVKKRIENIVDYELFVRIEKR